MVNCCVVGCPNSSSVTKLDDKVSYVGFPKVGEWLAKFLHAVKRKDKVNTATEKICTRHFTPDCLLFHGKFTFNHNKKDD